MVFLMSVDENMCRHVSSYRLSANIQVWPHAASYTLLLIALLRNEQPTVTVK